MQRLILKSKQERVKSGVGGLDTVIGGGLRPHTVNVVFGNTGCGKSTFAWNFVGEAGNNPALYVSLEQSLHEIVRESKSLGLDVFEKKVKNGTLHFHHAITNDSEMTAGEVSMNFLIRELPQHLKALQAAAAGYEGGIRIVIDPLTPLLFEVEGLNQLRNILSQIFSNLRSIGTTVITLEKGFDEVLARLPLYLGDSVFELDYLGLGGALSRTIQIRKMRGSKHSEKPHPLSFEAGKGLLVRQFD
ncbi:MAG: RAD55 family ATPase [Candidatus Hodarchaeales archaeon]|jgi:circadian clock protein KaiC